MRREEKCGCRHWLQSRSRTAAVPGGASRSRTATNIPNGTPVTCRVTSGATVQTLPATGTVTLAGGTATFTTTVQAGVGTIQAFANFTTPTP